MPTVTNLGPCDCCPSDVEVTCCENPLPSILYVTITASPGANSCYDGTYAMTYESYEANVWTFIFPNGTCGFTYPDDNEDTFPDTVRMIQFTCSFAPYFYMNFIEASYPSPGSSGAVAGPLEVEPDSCDPLLFEGDLVIGLTANYYHVVVSETP